MVNTDAILETMKNDLVYSSCSLQRVNSNDVMVLGNDASILVNRNFLTYVPYETEERETIHGNARNNITKQFIERYNLNELIAEYQEHVNKMILEEQEHVKSFQAMEILANELQPLFCGYGKLEAKHNYNTKIAELEFVCKLTTANQWMSYTDNLTVIVSGDIYNVNQLTFNRGNATININHVFTLEQFKMFITERITEYKQVEAEEKEQIEILNAERNKQIKISNIASRICNDKEHIYILKSKRSYVAIHRNTRYTTGIGKAGKYYNTDWIKVEKLINENGITEVLIFDKDFNTYNVDWKEYKFDSIMDIA